MLTNKGLKSFKCQTKIKSCGLREFESMALDMDHSAVPESTPFSAHSTVHTPPPPPHPPKGHTCFDDCNHISLFM